MASIDNFERSFTEEVYHMQTDLKKCTESKKVLMTNKLNRLHEWYESYNDMQYTYDEYKINVEILQ